VRRFAGLVELAVQAGESAIPDGGAASLGRNFSLDPVQIARLTRVFQHLVPRRLDRMELTPRLREEIRRAGNPDQPLAENAWEEVQEFDLDELTEKILKYLGQRALGGVV